MSLKEEFLKIKTYEEYDKKRERFRKLDFQDEEICQHFYELFPILEHSGFENGVITELYKTVYPRYE